MGRKVAKFQPTVFYDPFEMVGTRKIAVSINKDGTVNCIGWSIAYTCVKEFLIEEGMLGTRYHFVDAERDSPEQRGDRLKADALRGGATLEAVQLLGQLIPITKNEEYEMVEKLKGKASADKGALKDAAKAAPVGGGKKTAAAPAKKQGNAAALAKANETNAAKKAAQQADKRKITLTDKGKAKIKEGDASKGAVANLIKMRDAKTVGAAITGGLSMADLNYAAKNETITLG